MMKSPTTKIDAIEATNSIVVSFFLAGFADCGSATDVLANSSVFLRR
jgi:hypothetical protein